MDKLIHKICEDCKQPLFPGDRVVPTYVVGTLEVVAADKISLESIRPKFMHAGCLASTMRPLPWDPRLGG